MEETDEKVKTIKPINGNTVHKICSGQVVLNLSVAVKELVENSLDAGATSVDVRLKNYGIDLIEVTDNGSGVTEDNCAALTLKYHTSKLNDYSDLLGVTSFGFRGEALSSLCALANLTITTRHQSSEYATKIEYDHKGNIVKTSLCSRQVGTTVSLTNLFASLPVRQKEFHKNAKREFNKMTQLLYAYCLISIGVKITCSNQTSANQKSTVVATQGSPSYKDNIACVFGLKQLQTILELKPEYTPNIKDNILKGLSGETECTEDSVNIEDVEIDLSEDSNDTTVEPSQDILSSQNSLKSQGYTNAICPVEFTGFISSCAHGSGRSTSDRQFYFVNSRPCEPPKIMKLINEVYRQHNPNQYPFVFLNVTLDRSTVDINVTPDKRKVFLTKEIMILNVIKSSMLKLFESIPRLLKVESANDVFGKKIEQEVKANLDQPRIFNSFLQRFAKQSSRATEPSSNKNKPSVAELKRKSTTMLDFGLTKTRRVDEDNLSDDDQESEIMKSKESYKLEEADEVSEVNTKNQSEGDIIAPETVDHEANVDIKDEISVTEHSISESLENHKKQEIVFLESTDNLPVTQIRSIDDIVEKSHKIRCLTKSRKQSISPVKAGSSRTKAIVTDIEDLGKHNRRSVILKTSLEQVRMLTDIYSKQKNKTAPERVKFRTGINPVFNKKCEEELSREISKESFKMMKVIGQFNLAFIITQLEDDLFIIDQHATDEIYNFETLQKNTELTSQKLVIPQQLELTGVNEQILADNLRVFERNGFTFEIDDRAPPTRRVKLLTLPMSKNWIFGKEDIEELLFMLRESPSEHCRPSRVRAMFASRACRKSVMVGATLSRSDMRRLVDHMGEIDKPWNCPHGRPTIRHLVNMAMVHTQES